MLCKIQSLFGTWISSYCRVLLIVVPSMFDDLSGTFHPRATCIRLMSYLSFCFPFVIG